MYTTGSSIQYLIITYNKTDSEKESFMYVNIYIYMQ